MKRLLPPLLLFFIARASLGATGIFTPLDPNVTGLQHVEDVNGAYSALRPIEPSFSCYPFSFLPTVKNNQQVICQGCSHTNPCATGDDKVVAVGVCDNDGISNCQWNCNQGTPPGGEYQIKSVFSPAVTVLSTETNVYANSSTFTMGTSPTGKWWVHVDVSYSLKVDPGTQCQLRLYIGSDVTPSRSGEVVNGGAGGDFIQGQVTLSTDRLITGTSIGVFPRAKKFTLTAGACSVENDGIDSQSISSVMIFAIPY